MSYHSLHTVGRRVTHSQLPSAIYSRCTLNRALPHARAASNSAWKSLFLGTKDVRPLKKQRDENGEVLEHQDANFDAGREGKKPIVPHYEQIKLRAPDQPRKSHKVSSGGVVLTKDIVRSGSVLNSFTMEDLVAAKVHLGHHRTLWHPKIQPYLFGVRDDTHIFDLEQTMAHLRRALDVVRRVAHAGGIILFIGNRPQFEKVIRHTAIQCGEYYVTKKYKPGSLTNSVQTLGAEIKPDLMIFITLPVSKVALRESYYSVIPSLGIVDSDQDPTQVTYSIPGNDDNIESVELYCKLLKRAVQEGKLYRKQGMDMGDFAVDVHDEVQKLKTMSQKSKVHLDYPEEFVEIEEMVLKKAARDRDGLE